MEDTMTSDFSERLRKTIKPILDKVSAEDAIIAKAIYEKEENERLREEREAANAMKAEHFFNSSIQRIASSVADELSGTLQDDTLSPEGNEFSYLVLVKPKLDSEACYVHFKISCSDRAFSIQVEADGAAKVGFGKVQCFTSSEFTAEIAQDWLEDIAIEAAKFIVDNNRPSKLSD